MSKFDVDQLPEHMRDGMLRYLEQGIEGGDFMTAVLSNDLVGAYSRADEDNLRNMKAWAHWLYMYCPSEAWGSRAKVKAWLKRFKAPR